MGWENSIHFIDIFMYLNEESDFTFNTEDLLPEVIDSKREGYVEILGNLLFLTPKSSKLSLSSTLNFEGIPRIEIKNGTLLIDYNENSGDIKINGEILKFPIHYQSKLTGILVDSLINTGDCKLTAYATSATFHKNFLSKIGPFINKIKGWTSDSCPIT